MYFNILIWIVFRRSRHGLASGPDSNAMHTDSHRCTRMEFDGDQAWIAAGLAFVDDLAHLNAVDGMREAITSRNDRQFIPRGSAPYLR